MKRKLLLLFAVLLALAVLWARHRRSGGRTAWSPPAERDVRVGQRATLGPRPSNSTRVIGASDPQPEVRRAASYEAGHEGRLPELGHPDSIPGEYVLTFESREAREAFEALARRLGITVLDRMAFGQALRIRILDRGRLAALLAQAPVPTGIAPNVRLRIPPLAEHDPLAAPDMPYRGFGKNAVSWLGVDQVLADWGQGVVVAVLDTGMTGGAGMRINLTDSAPGSHGDAVAAVLRKLAPAATLMDVQVMDANGTGDAFTVAKGILEAVDRGASILNVSIGTRGNNPLLAAAIRDALERGVLVVASAGNEGVSGVSYPAAYEGVLSIGAVDADERHLYFSNRGSGVDLVAPGVGIAVAGPDGTVFSFHGTSASAPFVAATAAILKGLRPSLSGEVVAERLLATANDTGAPGRDDLTGTGILSPVRLLEHEQPGIVDMAVLRPFFQQDDDGELVQVELAAQNRGTTTLRQVRMLVTIDGVDKQVYFENVAPGMTVAYQLDPALYAEPDGSLDVQVAVPVTGDVRPGDNAVRSVFLPSGR